MKGKEIIFDQVGTFTTSKGESICKGLRVVYSYATKDNPESIIITPIPFTGEEVKNCSIQIPTKDLLKLVQG